VRCSSPLRFEELVFGPELFQAAFGVLYGPESSASSIFTREATKCFAGKMVIFFERPEVFTGERLDASQALDPVAEGLDAYGDSS